MDDIVPSVESHNLRVTADDNIILPQDVVQHLGARAGAKLILRKLLNGGVEIQPARSNDSIVDTFGMLKREGQRSISIDEMNEIIGRGWAGEL